jgi:hypothetical protein
MTPIEEAIQQLMEPDKEGDKGFPTRTAAFGDEFGHPIQRTLNALWKFAETSHIRIRELESALWRTKVEVLEEALPGLMERLRELEGDFCSIEELERVKIERDHALDNLKAEIANHREDNVERDRLRGVV